MIKKRPPLPAKKREEVAEMFKAGESAATISKTLDVNYEAVRSLIRRLSGIDRARRPNDGYCYGPHLSFNPKADDGLTYRYEDDPRADKLCPYGRVYDEKTKKWKTGWREHYWHARGEYDWGLNPVKPGR